MIDLKAFPKGVFMVNALGIVYDAKRKKIMIGRRENDPYVPALTWGFPGGRPAHRKDLESSLTNEVRKKTGLKVKVEKLAFARVLPEHGKIMLLYYLCTPVGGREKAGEKFVELKWIRPTDVHKYFTTSTHRFVQKMLKNLKKETKR